MNFSIKLPFQKKHQTLRIVKNIYVSFHDKEVLQTHSVLEEPVISPVTSLSITDACYITQFSSVVKSLIAGNEGGSYVTPVTGIEVLTCFK